MAQIGTKICSAKTAWIRFYSGHQDFVSPSMISSNGILTSLIFTCCELECGWKKSMFGMDRAKRNSAPQSDHSKPNLIIQPNGEEKKDFKDLWTKSSPKLGWQFGENLEVDTQSGISFTQDKTIQKFVSSTGKFDLDRALILTIARNYLSILLRKFALFCCSNYSVI